MEKDRHYSLLDRICLGFDQTLRALSGHLQTTGEPYPAENIKEAELNETERKHAAGLMRVNHAGEICAQALYHGQALVSRSIATQEKMQRAAMEEGDHLAWCVKRLNELDSHTSYLNPIWYFGSLSIGMMAGLAGDAVSLGFLAETEKQVIRHLDGHLISLPRQDQRSAQILQIMERDEAKHRDEAIALGAKELPQVVKTAMSFTAKIMVKLAYWI